LLLDLLGELARPGQDCHGPPVVQAPVGDQKGDERLPKSRWQLDREVAGRPMTLCVLPEHVVLGWPKAAIGRRLETMQAVSEIEGHSS
jgi:hypothetical protein